MSPVVDETAGDLPVRDVGLMRGGLMPAVKDTVRDAKPWKKSQAMKMKDRHHLFRVPREHLENQCLQLQEENSLLKQHARTQEQKLRRMSTRLMRLRQGPGSEGIRERDLEDTIQELEVRVATLMTQKEALQNKLSLARQHIMDLGTHTHHRFSKGKTMDGEGRFRRAAQTAPPGYGPTLGDTRGEIERFRSNAIETQQVKSAELELATQALRDALREKESQMEGAMRRDMRKQQVDGHRLTIRENVDLIRLQKQLSEKSTALRVSQEKFNNLQEAYDNQLEESQRSLKKSQGALLEKVEELSEQLKQERERVLALERQLTTATLSLQTLEEFQERVSDLEGERALLKEGYEALLESTLSAQSNHDGQAVKEREGDQEKEGERDGVWRMDLQKLEETLRVERAQRGRLEEENERLRREKDMLAEQRERERDSSGLTGDQQGHLEHQAVLLQYREQVATLQNRLDFINKEFDMSVEELSETLFQIKAFRLQQESWEGLRFLGAHGKEDSPGEPANIQALQAETVLELEKTRNLLLMEHHITKDLQEELKTVTQRSEREREESRRRMAEKDKLLSKRALQINTLQAQLKELAYSPRNYKRSIPIQYTWMGGDQEVVRPIEDDMSFSQLRSGESLLEIHLKDAAFTPGGLRRMGGIQTDEEIVTFCTYALLDFEVHSTPLVSGGQPNYGFTSRYALTAHDLCRLGVQGSWVRLELHQAIGGVRFVTRGSGEMSLVGAMERRGERVGGCVNITGSEGDIVGVVDFWVRLFPPAELVDTLAERGADRRAATQRSPAQHRLGWQDSGSGHQQELHDYGGGIPNELVIVMERCVGLSGRWPGLLPDAYLTYRLYDLPPHVTPMVQCAADPVFNDTVCYPLAVTTDVLHYLRSGSLWVYVFDDGDDQLPPAYLAKTPVPLRALATGRELRGDYVLRDPAGGPRGVVRVLIKWRYPFQPPVDSLGSREMDRAKREMERHGRGVDRAMESPERAEERREGAEESQRPIAKPRVKTQILQPRETKPVQKETKVQEVRPEQTTSVKSPATPLQSPDRKRSTKRSPDLYQARPRLTPEPCHSTPPRSPTTKSSERVSPRRSSATLSERSSASDAGTQDIPSLDQVSMDEEEERSGSAAGDSEGRESAESSSSQSDIVIVPLKRKIRKGDKLKVEILSLTFGPASCVAQDESVQRVYVEYRLLGVPMETTETPMSLRKPTEGEEIHYNFTRVIYVDGSQSAPLRQYLYTMLEGTDPSRGRLRFTVVSEPMDDDEECVDVGHSFLDLQELLLTGNDVIERQIDIVSVDEERAVIGKLKVSLEAAKALTGIYREFHRNKETKKEDETEEEREEEERKDDNIQVIDFDESDF